MKEIILMSKKNKANYQLYYNEFSQEQIADSFDDSPLEDDESYTSFDAILDMEVLCDGCELQTKTNDHLHGCSHLKCLEQWLKDGNDIKDYLNSSLYNYGTTGFNSKVNLPRINPNDYQIGE